MSKITKEWIASGAVDENAIKLSNNAYMKARNFANSGDVSIVKVNASNEIEFASLPKVAGNSLVVLDSNGFVPLTQIPPAALERLVIVADQAARYALTTATVQNGDTVKQTDTNVMYFVKDDTNLSSAAGYEVYSAGTASAVAWSGVTGTPTTLAGYGITDAVPSSRTVNGHALSSDVTVTKSDVGLGNVDNVQQLPMSYLDTDNTLAANSDSKVPSQKAVKSFVNTAIGSLTSVTPEFEVKTLSSGDITNQYIDLAYVALANSIEVFPKNGPSQTPIDDYTINYTGGVGGVTRITFAGDLASTLVAGMKLCIKYSK